MRRLILACPVLLASGAAPAAEPVGWSRHGLLDEMSRLVGETVVPEPTDGRLRLLDPTEDPACFMAPGDITTVMVETGRVGSVLLVGDAERVHSLQFYFPVVNMGADDRAGDYYEGIFRYLFPAGTPPASGRRTRSVPRGRPPAGQ